MLILVGSSDNNEKRKHQCDDHEYIKDTNISKFAQFENIHSWLESQDNKECDDHSCDCIDEEDAHYACVNVTNLETNKILQNYHSESTHIPPRSRFSSISSISCSADSLLSKDESCYSVQIRKQARSLYCHV